ncbi:MAG: HDOD domain-containing protein, partial [Planctomycetales bacterium]|nr:HDOD domain-containing protein [Planctomycetales bacterium]
AALAQKVRSDRTAGTLLAYEIPFAEVFATFFCTVCFTLQAVLWLVAFLVELCFSELGEGGIPTIDSATCRDFRDEQSSRMQLRSAPHMLKVSDRRRLSQIVQQALADRPEVRPFPAAVAQLLAACQDPNATASTFEKIIERDPALSVRLLRMANSPLYGLTNEVKGIAHAAAILGIRQLKHLALSVAGAGMFNQGSTAAQHREQLWAHSLGCATVARILAKKTPGVDADDAFLAGIFHDVGKLFLFDVVPEDYVELSSTYRGKELIEQEQFVFGVSHEEIGLKSAHSWSLAENLKGAIGYHHRPQESPVHVEFVTVIEAANNLARYWGIGSEGQEDPDAAARALDHLELSEDEVIQLAEQAVTNYNDAMQVMSA